MDLENFSAGIQVMMHEADLDRQVQTPMAQGRSTKIISMIKWIWTSRLSIKNSLSRPAGGLAAPAC